MTARTASNASGTTPAPAAGAATVKRRVAHSAKSPGKDAETFVLKDAERTRADILAVATKEFSQRGYSGGRINEIADRTRTSKRMIYYYFGSKQGLYKAVLFEHYRRLRGDEVDLHLEAKAPLEALRQLAHFTFDWYARHADEAPLVMVENIHHAAHIRSLPSIEELNSTVINQVQRIYERGVAEGVMRPGLRPMDIYLTIASASFFNVSNRYTFAAIFGHDLGAPAEVKRRRAAVTDTVLRYVVADPRALDG